jgi:hypothetical protein
MASTYLTRTFGSAGNRQSWTWSGWIKKSKIYNSTSSSDREVWFGGYTASNNTEWLEFGTQGDVFYYTTSGVSSSGNRVMRDPNGWFHAVVTYNGSNLKFYYNNELDFDNTGLSGDRGINVGGTHTIGAVATDQSIRRFNGVMSHVHFVDGAVLAPTVFGSTDSTTGEWKINANPTVSSYGTNGFFILKDGNSVTDQSGNSNNFTVSGGTLTKTEDSPSNVFCTWNPNMQSAARKDIVLTNGNTFIANQSSGDASVSGNIGISSGKYYWEQITNNPSGSTNACVIGGIHTAEDFAETPGNIIQNNTAGLYSNGNAYKDTTNLGNFTSRTEGTDIFGVGFDADNGSMYFWRNGSALNSGNAVITGLDTSKTWLPFGICHGGVLITTSTNFGNGYFGTTAVSSAGTNASGIGIFEYDVPTGYTALSTKGLNE